MSLLSFIQQPDVRAKFKAEFPKPKFIAKKQLQAPPETKNYQLVGTAFHYLLEFYVQYLNPQAKVRDGVDEDEKELLKKAAACPYPDNEVFKILANAKSHLSVFLKTGQFTEELFQSAMLLGKMDYVRRGGSIGDILQGLYDINKQDIQDLKNLIAIVDPNQFKSTAQVFINPVFGIASASVGGADADLIIGDLLIEIKVTKEFEFKREYFNQSIGYYILSVLNQKYEQGHYDSYDIKRIGVYFARHGYLHVMNVDDIVNPAQFPAFLEWLESRARGGAA
jgi:hypothetical protein